MTVFLILGVIGVVVLLVSLVLGDFLDATFHIEALDSDVFSLAALAAFVGAFGFGGVAAYSFSSGVLIPSAVGVVCGTAAAWSSIKLIRWLKRSETGTVLRSDHLIGAEARVITAIPTDGYGEVRIGSLKLSARADTAIPTGTTVWVMSSVSPTAVEVRAAASDLPYSQ